MKRMRILHPAAWTLVDIILLVLVVILLVGCAGTGERVTGSGVIAPPPPGWVDFCQRNPEDPSCKLDPSKKPSASTAK